MPADDGVVGSVRNKVECCGMVIARRHNVIWCARKLMFTRRLILSMPLNLKLVVPCWIDRECLWALLLIHCLCSAGNVCYVRVSAKRASCVMSVDDADKVSRHRSERDVARVQQSWLRTEC
jgi:hypothetical protein